MFLSPQHFYRTLLRLTGTLLLAMPLCALSGDEATETDFTNMSLRELMDLDVFTSASLLPQQSRKAPGTVYSFNQDDFTRFGVRRLEDLLQFVPGMQLNQYRKRHKSIWSRGLLNRYNDKMVLMVDGVRVKHLYYGHFSLGDNLPLENIEKVEIIQGPASSLYGANAFGGIISVTTRDFSDEPGMTVTVEAGNYDRRKASAAINSERFQAFGSTLTQDAPFDDNRKSFIGGAVLQPPDEDYTTLFLKARPIDGLTLHLDYSENETPFLFIPKTQDAFIENRMLTLAANYEAGDLQHGKLEMSVFHTADKASEYELEKTTQQLGYLEDQNAEMSGVLIKGLRELGEHTLAGGVSGEYEKATDTDYIRYFHYSQGFLDPPETGNLLSDPEASYTDYAAFIQDVWRLNPEVELTLGTRYDEFDQFGGHGNYRAAAVYTPNDQQTWKLMYGTAIRTPSLREYLKNLESDFIPPELEPEEIRSLELGYYHQWEEANLQLSLFRNEVEEFILETPTPDMADEYFANLADSWTLTGADSVLEYQLLEDITTRLALSYLEVRGSLTDDVPYLANWNGSFHIDYRFSDQHQLGLSLLYTGDRPETNRYTDDNPEATVTPNITLSGSLSKELRYSLGIDNLLDERIYNPAGDFGGQYNTENHGREIWLKIDWDFPG